MEPSSDAYLQHNELRKNRVVIILVPRHCRYVVVASSWFISNESATVALIHRGTLVNFIRSRYVLTAS